MGNETSSDCEADEENQITKTIQNFFSISATSNTDIGTDIMKTQENSKGEIPFVMPFPKPIFIKLPSPFDNFLIDLNNPKGVPVAEDTRTDDVKVVKKESDVRIYELVKKNSFMAYDLDDAKSLALDAEELDKIGDFSYYCSQTEVNAFEDLFQFMATNDYQLIMVDYPEGHSNGYNSIEYFTLYVLREKTK